MNRILLIFIEPTPYIVGLIKNIIIIHDGHVDIFFLKVNASQNWDLQLDKKWMILPKGNFAKLFLISKMLKKNNYNIVHIAGWSEPILIFTILLSKLLHIAVSVESDTPMPPYTKRWKRVIKRLVYPRLFKFVNLFLPGGKRQAKYLEYFGVNLERIIPAQMTVDVASIQKYIISLDSHNRIQIRQSYQIDENKIVYLYVGRLEAHKGIVDLISAFRSIINKEIILLIVGDGSLRSLIESVVESNENIYYAGRLSAEKLIDAYYAADVVVLPSHFEPWGLVVNEAMAAGKPVIVSDRVGCIDDLVTVNTGIITQTENVDDLRQSIESLAKMPYRRIEMGNNAKQKIASWTLENEAENICNAWKQIINV